MNGEDLLKLYKKSILSTWDGKYIPEQENRYNQHCFSYTGDSKIVHVFPFYIMKFDGSSMGKSIKLHRESELTNIKSQTTVKLRNFCYCRGYRYRFDREVLVWIIRSKWLDVCKKFGLEDTPESIMRACYDYPNKCRNDVERILHKRYIMLDLLDPIRGVNIEHDGSKYHDKDDIGDKIRDEYLREVYPELIIKRVRDFDENSATKISDFSEFLFRNENRILDHPMSFDFSEQVLDRELCHHQVELKMILENLKTGKQLNQINLPLAYSLYEFKKKLKSA